MQSDSLINVVASPQAFDFLDQMLLYVIAGVIAPLVAWLKQKEWIVCGPLRPEFVKTILAIGAAYGLAALLNYSTNFADLIQRAFQALGEALPVYGLTRWQLTKRSKKKSVVGRSDHFRK